MTAPFDTLLIHLPGYPLEILALILILDALGLGALALYDAALRRRS